MTNEHGVREIPAAVAATAGLPRRDRDWPRSGRDRRHLVHEGQERGALDQLADRGRLGEECIYTLGAVSLERQSADAAVRQLVPAISRAERRT